MGCAEKVESGRKSFCLKHEVLTASCRLLALCQAPMGSHLFKSATHCKSFVLGRKRTTNATSFQLLKYGTEFDLLSESTTTSQVPRPESRAPVHTEANLLTITEATSWTTRNRASHFQPLRRRLRVPLYFDVYSDERSKITTLVFTSLQTIRDLDVVENQNIVYLALQVRIKKVKSLAGMYPEPSRDLDRLYCL